MAVISPDLMKLDIAALGERAWRWWVEELRGIWDSSWLRDFGKEAEHPILTLSADNVLQEPPVMPSRKIAEIFARIPGGTSASGYAATVAANVPAHTARAADRNSARVAQSVEVRDRAADTIGIVRHLLRLSGARS